MTEAVAHDQPWDAHVCPTTSWVRAAPLGSPVGSGRGLAQHSRLFVQICFRQSKPLTQFCSGGGIAVRLDDPHVTALGQIWQKVARRRQELTLWQVSSKPVFFHDLFLMTQSTHGLISMHLSPILNISNMIRVPRSSLWQTQGWECWDPVCFPSASKSAGRTKGLEESCCCRVWTRAIPGQSR